MDIFVRIELTDVNGDGKDELIIDATPKNDITYNVTVAILPWNNEESDEWELEAYAFGLDVEQPGIRTSEAWILMKIGMEYDDEAKRFRQGGDVTIE